MSRDERLNGFRGSEPELFRRDADTPGAATHLDTAAQAPILLANAEKVARPARPLVRLPRDDRQVAGLVNRLAWPVILENIFQSLLEIINTVLVARLGAAAIAGMGGAVQIVWVISAAFFAISVGTTVLVARFVGAGDFRSANRVAKQSILLVLSLGAVIAVVGHLYSYEIVALLGVEPDVARLGGDYFQVVSEMSIFFIGMFVLGGILRGAGDTRTPMVVTGGINVVNIVLAYVLIFGVAGSPAMGVRGAALAAGIARAMGALLLLWILYRGRAGICIAGSSGWAPDIGLMKRLLHIGVPALVENVMMSGGMLVYSLIVVRMGTVTFAAFRITMNAMMLSIMPGFGFAMAATTLTGQSLGAQRPELANNSTRYAERAAVIWMTAMGVGFFVFGEPIMRLFTEDPEMIDLGVIALRVIALAQPFQALALVSSGSLRGAGDTRFPMVATALSMWLVRVPFGYLLGLPLGLGLAGVYFSTVLDSALRAFLNKRRHREGGWRHIEV